MNRFEESINDEYYSSSDLKMTWFATFNVFVQASFAFVSITPFPKASSKTMTTTSARFWKI